MTATAAQATRAPGRAAWLLPVFGYPFFFLLCFVVSLYLTFPINVLKGRILEEMTRAINAQKNPGQYGKAGRVTADDVGLYRLSGLSFNNLVIYPVTTNPDPPSPIEVESLKVRLQLFSVVKKPYRFAFEVNAYDGKITGEVGVDETFKQVKFIRGNGDGVAWGKIAAIRDKLKVPAEGTLGGEVDLVVGKDPKEHNGTIKLRGEALVLGPGELAIPAFGSLTLPRVDLGKLDGEIKVADGKTSGPPMTLTGKDIQGQAEAPLALRSVLDSSTILNGVMTFKLADEFLKANPKFQTVFDLAPPMKNAKDDEGVFHFRLKGTLRSPDVRPDRTAKVSGAAR